MNMQDIAGYGGAGSLAVGIWCTEAMPRVWDSQVPYILVAVPHIRGCLDPSPSYQSLCPCPLQRVIAPRSGQLQAWGPPSLCPNLHVGCSRRDKSLSGNMQPEITCDLPACV